jgi:hypothetical protein
MSILSALRPGDIMFARHVSPASADRLIWAGQLMLGDPTYPHHVAVVVENSTGWPKIVQAMPHGAEEIVIGEEHATSDYVYLRPDYFQDDPAQGPDLRVRREAVAHAARAYVGVPYSFADYAAIAGWHFGIKNGPIRRYVTTSKHMICSQLADQALSDAGFHVFDDGRLPQDVTPGALFRKLQSMAGTVEVS